MPCADLPDGGASVHRPHLRRRRRGGGRAPRRSRRKRARGTRATAGGAVKILLWHVHGAWTTSFVHGEHEYLVPTVPGRGPDGRGRAETYEWPPWAREVGIEQAADEHVDVVILQRPHELDGRAAQWLGGRPPREDGAPPPPEAQPPPGPPNAKRDPPPAPPQL